MRQICFIEGGLISWEKGCAFVCACAWVIWVILSVSVYKIWDIFSGFANCLSNKRFKDHGDIVVENVDNKPMFWMQSE